MHSLGGPHRGLFKDLVQRKYRVVEISRFLHVKLPGQAFLDLVKMPGIDSKALSEHIAARYQFAGKKLNFLSTEFLKL